MKIDDLSVEEWNLRAVVPVRPKRRYKAAHVVEPSFRPVQLARSSAPHKERMKKSGHWQHRWKTPVDEVSPPVSKPLFPTTMHEMLGFFTGVHLRPAHSHQRR